MDTTNIDSVEVEGRDITNPLDIAQAMNDYLCSVGKNLRDKTKPQPNPLLSNEYTIVENTTHFEFVAFDVVAAKKALSKMKNSFGFGSDGIASYFINIAFPLISQPLCDILIFSIYTGIFPDSWKTARVAPIFKNGERDGRSNYRPISILPVLSRLFEKLVYDQLYNHLDKNKLLYTFQSGFRTLHSIATCLLKSTNDWYVNIDNSKVNAVLFIDLKKGVRYCRSWHTFSQITSLWH